MAAASGDGAGVRVYARLRPGGGGESPFIVDGAHLRCPDCVPCEFSHPCFAGQASNAEVFDAVAPRILGWCLKGTYPRGGFGAAVAYGEGRSGRTHTMLGSDADPGIVPRSLRYLFANGAGRLRLQVCQLVSDSCQDLLSDRDGCKMAVDDRLGVVAELQEEVCADQAAAEAVVARAAQRRQPRAEAAGSSPEESHFVVLVSVDAKGAVGGRAAFVDLARTDRAPGVSAGVHETGSPRRGGPASRVRTLGVFEQCVSGVALGRDHKTLPFREAKVTRVLQHPLVYAGAAQGAVGIIVCLAPDGAANRAARSLTFAARCLAAAPGLSVGHLKDTVGVCEQLSEEADRNADEILQRLQPARHALAALQAQGRHSEQEVLRVEAALEEEKHEARRQAAREHSGRRPSGGLEQQRGAVLAARQELEQARRVIQGAPGAAEAAVQAMRLQAEQEMLELRRRADREVAQERDECDALTRQQQALRWRSDQLHAWGARVQRELKQLQEEEQELAGKAAKATGPSRTAGLSEEELRRKRPYFALLDEVDELEEHNAKQREKVRSLAAAAGVDAGSESDAASSSEGSHPLRFLGEGSDAEGVTPPSSAPGPSEKSSELPPTPPTPPAPEPETETSSSLSSLSTGPEVVPEEDPVQRAQREADHREKQEQEAIDAAERERRQFYHTVMRERKLQVLVHDIIRYLEHGSEVTVVVNNTQTPPWLQRALLYVAREGTLLCLCPQDPKTKKCERRNIKDVIELKQVRSIGLGQCSDAFKLCRQRCNTHEHAHDPTQPMPPSTGELHREQEAMGAFFYRSISLELGGKKRKSLDFIVDSDQDFEAWIVALHRHTALDPHWGEPLNIRKNKGYERLLEHERKFCSENHISPLNFINARQQVLTMPRLLITLFDVRTTSTLDLIHSQKLFAFLSKQGQIDKTVVWPIRFAEKSAPDDAPEAPAEPPAAADAPAAAEDK